MLAQQTGDHCDLADAYALLGEAAGCLGEPAKAKTLLLKSIALVREGGSTQDLVSGYTSLGNLALSLDDTREAEN